jgi:HK97 family phage major capsid protein
MAMTAAEARNEIKNRLDQADVIEKKYNDPEKMPNEERDAVKRLLEEVDNLETKMALLEDSEQRRARILRDLDRHSKPAAGARPSYDGDDEEAARRVSPGRQFLASQEYRQMKQGGAFNSPLNRVEFGVQMADGTSLLTWADTKALLRGGSSTSGGPFVLEDHRPGFLEILQAELNLIDLIPRSGTSSDTIEYVREDTFTNAAAFVAEASGFTASTLGGTGLKPESALAYSTQTSTVRTMAHWIPVTNRMLADAPAIRGIIDSRLLFGLAQKLTSQVISGDGAGENLTGILNGNINVVSKGADLGIDALFKGRTLIRTTGHGRPGAYVINPADWQTIRLSRENVATGTLGGYQFGPPSTAGATTLWGLPVVEDEAMPAGTALVADWVQGGTLFDREQGAVRVGTVNDQFIRNMQTILAELRVAWVIWRPTVFTKITGL